MTFIEDAEKALEGITPGPWRWAQEDMDTDCPIWTLAPGVLIADGPDGTPDGDKIDQANARFIAAAPTLLRQAITEVRGRDEAAGFMQWVIDKLKAENAELREAVRAVLDDACPAEQGDETLVKSHLVSDLRAALTPDPEAGKTVKVFVTHGTSWRGDVLGSDPSNSITVDGE